MFSGEGNGGRERGGPGVFGVLMMGRKKEILYMDQPME